MFQAYAHSRGADGRPAAVQGRKNPGAGVRFGASQTSVPVGPEPTAGRQALRSARGDQRRGRTRRCDAGATAGDYLEPATFGASA